LQLKPDLVVMLTPGYLIAAGDKPGAINVILGHIDDLDSVFGSPW